MPVIADWSFILSVMASIMSMSKPTALPSAIDSNGGKVAAAPQVSLPASISGSVCADAIGAATSAANANSNIIGRRGMPLSFL